MHEYLFFGGSKPKVADTKIFDREERFLSNFKNRQKKPAAEEKEFLPVNPSLYIMNEAI